MPTSSFDVTGGSSVSNSPLPYFSATWDSLTIGFVVNLHIQFINKISKNIPNMVTVNRIN